MNNVHCLKCKYLQKTPGVRNIVFLCRRWGLKSVNKIPSYIVASSIGKQCPFYEEKKNNLINPIQENNDNLNFFI